MNNNNNNSYTKIIDSPQKFSSLLKRFNKKPERETVHKLKFI